MSYLALYRKYRPNTFDKLIGQDHIVKTLINQIESGKIGHAYLFTGTRGTGKTSAAKIFAKAINCLHPVNGSPCGECEVCKALADPSNIDVIEIDAASNNGVNEIRDLREKVQYAPVSCKYKVYIIDEVHMLSGAAFNALLKTLEEPPKHAVFILATTEVHKIPATILSRCMRFDFRLVPVELLVDLIKKIYDEQGKEYDESAVFAIASAGEGSVRDSLSIADTALSYGKGKLTYEDVMDILGSSNFSVTANFVESVIYGDSGKVLGIINELSSLGKSVGILVKDVISVIRNVLIVKTCKNAEDILKIPEDKFLKLKDIAEKTNEDRLVRILKIYTDMENELRYSLNPRIVFETASIKATRPDADYDMDALISRIKTLEDVIKSGKISVQNNDRENQVEKKVLFSEKEESQVEKITEKATEESTNEEEKLSIKDFGAESILGKLLLNLRKDGHEMLWSVMQSVKAEVTGNTFSIITVNEGDSEILSRDDNRKFIEDALSEFNSFSLQIKDGTYSEKSTKVEDGTDKIKSIFGDDIVIVDE